MGRGCSLHFLTRRWEGRELSSRVTAFPTSSLSRSSTYTLSPAFRSLWLPGDLGCGWSVPRGHWGLWPHPDPEAGGPECQVPGKLSHLPSMSSTCSSLFHPESPSHSARSKGATSAQQSPGRAWACGPVSSEPPAAHVCLWGAGLPWVQGQRWDIWKSQQAFLHPRLPLGKGELGPGKGPSQGLGAASSLPGLCLIQAKLSEMEEVKPAR